MADFPFPIAETTVRSALVRDHEEHAVRIPVDQTGHGAQTLLVERVFRGVGILDLLPVRHDLSPDGIAGIIDQREHKRVDAHGIASDDRTQLTGAHRKDPRELIQAEHAARQDFLPRFRTRTPHGQ